MRLAELGAPGAPNSLDKITAYIWSLLNFINFFYLIFDVSIYFLYIFYMRIIWMFTTEFQIKSLIENILSPITNRLLIGTLIQA